MTNLYLQATWIFAFSLISRVGVEGWSAWIVYVLIGTVQVALVITAIVFAMRDRRKVRGNTSTNEEANERSALLSN